MHQATIELSYINTNEKDIPLLCKQNNPEPSHQRLKPSDSKLE